MVSNLLNRVGIKLCEIRKYQNIRSVGIDFSLRKCKLREKSMFDAQELACCNHSRKYLGTSMKKNLRADVV